MRRKLGLRAGALALVLGVMLASASVGAAAGGLAPRLLSPNHKQVNPGAIRIVVKVPVTPLGKGVFVAITPTKKRDKYGHLKECFSTIRCDFVSVKRWKGSKYSYVAAFNFPGYWSVTAGRYYWQAHYYTSGNVYYSGIGSFVVK